MWKPWLPTSYVSELALSIGSKEKPQIHLENQYLGLRFKRGEIYHGFFYSWLLNLCMYGSIAVVSISEYPKEGIHAFCASIRRLCPYSAANFWIHKGMLSRFLAYFRLTGLGVRGSNHFCFCFVLFIVFCFCLLFVCLLFFFLFIFFLLASFEACPFLVHSHSLNPHTFLSTSKAWLVSIAVA